MIERYHYEIEMETQIGIRKGTLLLLRNDKTVSGWIEILSGKEELHGIMKDENHCEITGCIRSLDQSIPYEALCEIGKERMSMTIRIRAESLKVTGKADSIGILRRDEYEG